MNFSSFLTVPSFSFTSSCIPLFLSSRVEILYTLLFYQLFCQEGLFLCERKLINILTFLCWEKSSSDSDGLILALWKVCFSGLLFWAFTILSFSRRIEASLLDCKNISRDWFFFTFAANNFSRLIRLSNSCDGVDLLLMSFYRQMIFEETKLLFYKDHVWTTWRERRPIDWSHPCQSSCLGMFSWILFYVEVYLCHLLWLWPHRFWVSDVGRVTIWLHFLLSRLFVYFS